MSVHGFCEPRFNAVRDEFERNLAERGEVGASVCITLHGETVVDLWGGVADRHTGRPWAHDTIGLVWSCTKGAVAVCAHLLSARGLLDIDAPVAAYWPAFAQAGKADIPVRWLLDHQAGLPAFREPLKPGGLYEWDYLTSLLAAQEPLWPPGTRQGYHAATFGHLVGEVVRRVSGRDVGVFFRDEVAGLLGLDFHIGLPPEHEARVAPTIRPDLPAPGEVVSEYIRRAYGDPTSLQALVVKNTGRRPSARDHDSPEAHRALLPSQGGITNARGLAGLYAPLALGGMHRGVRLVDTVALARMGAVSSASGVDAVLLVGLRFALGFMKSSDNRRAAAGVRDSLTLSEEAFGHPGMGGSLGFADPGARMSFGYTMSKQGRGVLLNRRGQSLVDATYRCLGYDSDAAGRWLRR
jgi:CubicO group peptidase (beta-lactamase class C family)